MATIFAWSGALKKRGELDNLPALVSFGHKMEQASLQAIKDGIMTKDLVTMYEGGPATAVNTQEFLSAVRQRLEKLLF